jgi:UDP-N-acetylglucosamine 2-epimerase (non-hydrolysing)
MRQLSAEGSELPSILLHTGQHYDASMKQSFFDQLNIPEPQFDLGVGSGSHAQQTAAIMQRFEPVLDQVAPLAVLVVGDVNSTIACALVASKRGIPVFHVEAGLRSFDRAMPEEINRVLTDQISDLLFTSERSAADNLAREGIDSSKIEFVGNVMIDNLLYNLPRARSPEETLREHRPDIAAKELAGEFGLLTLHRPSNVDDPVVLETLLGVLQELGRETPLIWPLHPRTKGQIETHALGHYLSGGEIIPVPPVGYLEMLGLMRAATVVLTDSGGIQEETTALGIPCITLRENTERPITVTQGTNSVVGTNPDLIRSSYREKLAERSSEPGIPEYWDGRAAERITVRIRQWRHELLS